MASKSASGPWCPAVLPAFFKGCAVYLSCWPWCQPYCEAGGTRDLSCRVAPMQIHSGLPPVEFGPLKILGVASLSCVPLVACSFLRALGKNTKNLYIFLLCRDPWAKLKYKPTLCTGRASNVYELALSIPHPPPSLQICFRNSLVRSRGDVTCILIFASVPQCSSCQLSPLFIPSLVACVHGI